jgi:hypothetical protein
MKYLKLSLTVLFTGLWAASSHGVTNLVQTITVSAVTYSQGSTTTNGTLVTKRLAGGTLFTPDVVNVIGTSLGTTFSSKARLLRITPLLPPDESAVVIQDGTNRTDVSGFFDIDAVSDTMESSILDIATGRFTAVDFDVQRFQFHNAGGFPDTTLHFDVQGFTSTRSQSVAGGGLVIGQAPQVVATVAGPGDRGGTNLVVRGSIRILGVSLEVR